jgi:Sporulation protein YtfJ (Spore_YtfJ)
MTISAAANAALRYGDYHGDGERRGQKPQYNFKPDGHRAPYQQRRALVFYGEPVIVGEKKVIPVARVACGFGGGAGTAPLQRRNPDVPHPGGEGGGGGGGFAAMPVGGVEITPGATRFIRFGATRRVLGAFAFGILFWGCGWP